MDSDLVAATMLVLVLLLLDLQHIQGDSHESTISLGGSGSAVLGHGV